MDEYWLCLGYVAVDMCWRTRITGRVIGIVRLSGRMDGRIKNASAMKLDWLYGWMRYYDRIMIILLGLSWPCRYTTITRPTISVRWTQRCRARHPYFQGPFPRHFSRRVPQVSILHVGQALATSRTHTQLDAPVNHRTQQVSVGVLSRPTIQLQSHASWASGHPSHHL